MFEYCSRVREGGSEKRVLETKGRWISGSDVKDAVVLELGWSVVLKVSLEESSQQLTSRLFILFLNNK